MNAGPVAGPISIATQGGRRYVLGYQFGDWAATLVPDVVPEVGHSPWWAITHVPTGMYVGTIGVLDEGEAMAIARALSDHAVSIDIDTISGRDETRCVIEAIAARAIEVRP